MKILIVGAGEAGFHIATRKLARARSADFDSYHCLFTDQPPFIDTIINPEIEVVNTIEQLTNVPGSQGGKTAFRQT